MNATLKFKLIETGAMMPERQSAGASGYDLHAIGNHIVTHGHTVVIRTGVAFEIPRCLEGQVRGRSSFAAKGIHTHPGTIDSDYRGGVGVVLTNLSQPRREVDAGGGVRWIPGKPLPINHGDRIAQIVFAPVWLPELVQVDALDETERGDGGFGSTGAGGFYDRAAAMAAESVPIEYSWFDMGGTSPCFHLHKSMSGNVFGTAGSLRMSGGGWWWASDGDARAAILPTGIDPKQYVIDALNRGEQPKPAAQS